MRLSPKEERAVWDAMDRDKSGTISRKEFMAFWVRDDEEDTGKWDMEDTNRLRSRIQRYVRKHRTLTYDKLFDAVDDDASNMINFAEFERMLDSIDLGFSTAEARYVALRVVAASLRLGACLSSPCFEQPCV